MMKKIKGEDETEKEPEFEDNIFGPAAKAHWIGLLIVGLIALIVWLVKLLS